MAPMHDTGAFTMKNFMILGLCGLLSSPSWGHIAPWDPSPQLKELIIGLKLKYASPALSNNQRSHMTRVDNLSFFISHIDQPGTPEHAQLKAFLWGMQKAHAGSIYQQIRTNVVPWFCPKGGQLRLPSPNSPNPTVFIENLIYETLERDLQRDPKRFERYNGSAAFMSVPKIVTYGLQIKYPCYRPIPERHRLPGWVY
ncbi:conserved exported hypothetical protein [Vibrio nigripulchritudo Wn13]|nr:conserved exported hypothetical protein [Vibrio nigripulchritudo BLFn1]CCN97755.1 conserved exported hypothetical protein [Vibrio nigripulchritudo ENn2]CCO56066.1 conserved exported hypothetical protein [Vibrio nigripulchritudo Wn13]